MGIFYHKGEKFTVALAFARLLLPKTKRVWDGCDAPAPSARQPVGEMARKPVHSAGERVSIYLPVCSFSGGHLLLFEQQIPLGRGEKQEKETSNN